MKHLFFFYEIYITDTRHDEMFVSAPQKEYFIKKLEVARHIREISEKPSKEKNTTIDTTSVFQSKEKTSYKLGTQSS